MLKQILFSMLLTLSFSVSAQATKINGAGATFPYPIYSKWFSEYKKINPKIEINYQSIGSGAGIKQVLAQTVDFGASDTPLSAEEKKNSKQPLVQIPMVLGAVAVTYNVKGLPNNLKLNGDVIADIYQGKILKWNDPQIQKSNPDVKLPNADILPVRRSDGSGTTAIFTEFLSAVSEEWKTKYSSGKNIKWSVGLGAKGNEGVTAMVSQIDGAIGYVELAYAINSKLNVAAVLNPAGEYVSPELSSISNAALSIKNFDGDFTESIINSKVKNSYPLSSFTYIIFPTEHKNIAHLKSFLSWALSEGQAFTKELNFASLPNEMRTKILSRLK